MGSDTPARLRIASELRGIERSLKQVPDSVSFLCLSLDGAKSKCSTLRQVGTARLRRCYNATTMLPAFEIRRVVFQRLSEKKPRYR